MDVVVIISARGARRAQLSSTLRDAGYKTRLRPLDDTIDEVAVDGPDLVIVEIPEGAKADRHVRTVVSAPGMDSIPVLALIVAARLNEVVGIGDLAEFCLLPLRDGELVARVRRLLRRPGENQDQIVNGQLVIDLKGREASVAGTPLDMTYQEFQLLKFLVGNPGQAFSRDQLLARVWGYDYYGGSRTVDIHVRRIRAKVGHPHAGCLKTVRHVGYKWVLDAAI